MYPTLMVARYYQKKNSLFDLIVSFCHSNSTWQIRKRQFITLFFPEELVIFISTNKTSPRVQIGVAEPVPCDRRGHVTW